MKKFASIILVQAILLTLSSCILSCKKDDKKYDWDWEKEVPASEKPRFIWIDAAANFPDFANSKANIARDLALAKDAGFTDIVLDVRPATGDVLFKTNAVDQVCWLGAWVGSNYIKVERTETWDYLEAFIEEGHKLGLKVHAGINTFTGGNSTSLGDQGVVFRDENKRSWTTQLNMPGGVVSIMDTSNSAKFFNPVLPEVQDYICSMLRDLASYKGLDGIVLDRGRFEGFQSDFSQYTRSQFEKYAGEKVARFPDDIIKPGTPVSSLPSPLPKHFKKWLEFRARIIHDFIVKARDAVKSVNPDIKFGAYVGGWYSTYYEVGVNWASPKFNTAGSYTWATSKYQDYGYADHLDFLLIGAYAAADKISGTTEWTMQGFCSLAKKKTMGDTKVIGGPDVGNWKVPAGTDTNKSVELSVGVCINACDGYFLFDMIHLKKTGQWQYVKKGIQDAVNKK